MVALNQSMLIQVTTEFGPILTMGHNLYRLGMLHIKYFNIYEAMFLTRFL